MRKIISLIFICAYFLHLQTCKNEPAELAKNLAYEDKATIAIRIMKEPRSLSPILSNTSARQIFRLMHLPLMHIDPKKLELVPAVAKSKAEVEAITEGEHAGGKKYTYEIREDAKWDDGQNITAYDVIFSNKIMYHPAVKTRYSQIADLIAAFEVDEQDPKKFSFLTKECHILNEETLSTIFLYPEHFFDPDQTLRKHSLEELRNEDILKKIEADPKQMSVGEKFMAPESGRTAEGMLGTGPYRLKEWITGQKIVLEKKENYWGASVMKANPEQIVFEIVPDHVTALTKLGNNELDICGDLSFDLFNDQKSKAQLMDRSYDMTAIYYLPLNNESKILKDKAVRQALAHATNIEEIIENVTYGYARTLTGPYSPDETYYDKNLGLRKYDIKKAIEILAAAGWKDSDGDGIQDKIIDGKKTDLALDFYIPSSSKNMKPIADLFLKSTKKAGFKINVIAKDSRMLRKEHLAKGDYDISGTGTIASVGLFDPKYRWHSESIPPKGGNYPRFNNAKADALIDAIRTSCDDAQGREKMYKELHQIIYDEQPVIFLYMPKALLLTTNKIDDLVTSLQRPGYFPEYINKKK